jgi:hypothetical protein
MENVSPVAIFDFQSDRHSIHDQLHKLKKATEGFRVYKSLICTRPDPTHDVNTERVRRVSLPCTGIS